ncbi:PREDICTED: nucleoporin NUP53 [Atta cephalotes]|uniref:Nucleoporin NUP53 n=2 Tax=Atta TaxID=12956 RepID=A0A158NKH9_ATTCE|nr:PREDICTED: nucleoporin NUP53 [Atta cephalotes]XP_018054911.1 PREDICTED: nucleoporin NUP53 [Atta colombica]XP_018054912.1 PREDICTED: nucleoporin NUP53 [Atta colombica]KYM77855.1 Nucleoporin NUP53 [Atta colombica]
MEPMTLGSPMNSPVQSPGSPGNSSSYLPSFLLGDTNTPAKINIISPQDNPRHLNLTNTSVMSPVSYGSPDYRSNRQKAVFGSTTPSTPQISTKNHTGGPPTRGLFDTLEVTHISPSMAVTNPAITATPINQSKLMMSTLTSPLIFPDSSFNLSTSESQSLLQWVTVFGFLPIDVNAVLSHISSRVRIVDKHPAPQPQSNWIHLKCASEQEAQKALMCNGSIVSGTIMIGVIPCTDEGVVLGCDKENRAKLNGSMRSLSMGRISQSPFNSSPTARRRKLRSLAAGYNQHFSPQAAQMPENVPQKSASLVSKAMEYVFGW